MFFKTFAEKQNEQKGRNYDRDIRRSLGLGLSEAKRARDCAEDERKAANEIIERLTEALHVARGALMFIDTDYSLKIADDLASAIDPSLKP